MTSKKRRDALLRIRDDYEAESLAARRIAETFFDGERIARDLLVDIGADNAINDGPAPVPN